MWELLIRDLPIFTEDKTEPSLEALADELGISYEPELEQEQIVDLLIKVIKRSK